MASFALSLTALVLVVLLLGVHLTGHLILNPVLRRMDAGIYVPVKQAIDITAPTLAKPLMLLCLAASAGALIAASLTGAAISAISTAIALGALIVTLVAILRGDQPINRSMANWSPTEPPAEWRTTRDRWEQFFVLRVAANTVALLAAGTAVVASAMGLG